METIDSAKLYNGNRPLISGTIFKGYLFILDITTFQKVNIKHLPNRDDLQKDLYKKDNIKVGFATLYP